MIRLPNAHSPAVVRDRARQPGIGTAALLALLSACLLALCGPDARAQGMGNVLTQHNNNFRTGLFNQETILTPASVNVKTFGKLFTRKVDGQLYAQPLYVSNVSLPDGSVRNVLYLATEHNSVYAYDADDPTASDPIWQVNLGSPLLVGNPVAGLGGCMDLDPEVGITGTPVIDPDTGTLYVVVKTQENFDRLFVQRLHALDITTGEEKFGGPVDIRAAVPGTGGGSFGTGMIVFDARIHKNTPGSLLIKTPDFPNGVVYLTFASHCDYYYDQYHGWVLGFDAQTLQLVKAFNTTPDGRAAGIWQAGKAPAADENGNIYLETGNGDVTAPFGGRDYGEAFVKLSTASQNPFMTVSSWFIPSNYNDLNNADNDLGASGPMLIPGTNVVVGGGKEGILYVLNRDRMGGLSPGDNQVIQKVRTGNGHIHLTPVYFDAGPGNEYIYTWQEYDFLKSYRFTRGAGQPLATTPTAIGSKFVQGHPGGALAVSSNGTSNGIVWALQNSRDANHATVPGTLYAYDALTLKELWNSDQYGTADRLASFPKFCAPTIANGKVYAATFSGEVDVYGLITGGQPQKPLIKLTQPTNGSVYPTGTVVQVCADAQARGDSVARVDFYDNGELVGTATIPTPPDSSTYCIDWTATEGNHTLIAIVTTASGASATSNRARVQAGVAGGTTRDYAVNAGGPDAPADAGSIGFFAADMLSNGGNTASSPDTTPIDRTGVTNPAPAAVYRSERWGNFSYTLPNLTPGSFYTVRLHFAENVFDMQGQRMFNVAINGQRVLTNFDILAPPPVGAGAKNKAIVKEFLAVADSLGRITIQFSQGTRDNPKISGIEVIGAPTPPLVNITSPANGASLLAGPTNVTAFVEGVDSVTFYAKFGVSENPIGTVSGIDPYPARIVRVSWSPSFTGNYTLRAVGTVPNDGTVNSNQVNVSVLSARIISINFQGGGGGGTPSVMAPGEFAGALSVANWNNAAPPMPSSPSMGTVSNLKDYLGAQTTAAVTWSAANTWSTGIPDLPGDFRMMKGYLDTNSTSTTTVTVTGLPFTAYDVYVYFDGDNGGESRTGVFKIGNTTIRGTDAGGVNFNGTYIRANNSAGNYLVFTNVTGASFTLTVTPEQGPNTPRAPVNGIQIVHPQ